MVTATAVPSGNGVSAPVAEPDPSVSTSTRPSTWPVAAQSPHWPSDTQFSPIPRNFFLRYACPHRFRTG